MRIMLARQPIFHRADTIAPHELLNRSGDVPAAQGRADAVTVGVASAQLIGVCFEALAGAAERAAGVARSDDATAHAAAV